MQVSLFPWVHYVICVGMDQTIGFLDAKGFSTARHPEACLYSTEQEARTAQDAFYVVLNSSLPDDAWIEEVLDVAEFRTRPDTW